VAWRQVAKVVRGKKHVLAGAVFVLLTTVSFAQALWSVPQPVNSSVSCVSTDSDLPQISTDGAGNLMAAWLQGGLFRTGLRVVTAYSVDSGNTWTTPSLVNRGDVAESKANPGTAVIAWNADIAYAGNNVWVCSWTLQNSGSSRTIVKLARSTDRGYSWSEAGTMAVGDGSTYDDGIPSVDLVSDAAGVLMATWVFNRGNQSSKMFISRSTDFGATWSTPQQPYDPTLLVGESKLACSSNGTWYHAYSPVDPASTGRSLEVARSMDSGATWQRRELRGTAGGTLAYMLGGIAAKDNIVIAAYTTYDPRMGGETTSSSAQVNVSSDGGLTWDLPQPVARGTYTPNAIAAGDGGSWAVIATQYDSTTYNRKLSIYHTDDVSTTWSSVEIPTSPGPGYAPPALAWVDNNKFLAVYANTSSTITSLRSNDSGSSWSATDFPHTSAQYYDRDDHSRNFSVVAGEGGTMLGTWSADCDCNEELAISRSTDYGRTWSPATAMPYYSQFQIVGNYRKASVTYNGEGRWHVSWISEGGHFSSVSMDDGITWTTPRLTVGVYAGNGKGTLLHSTQSFWSPPPWPQQGIPDLNRVSRSENGGTSWTRTAVDVSSTGVPEMIHSGGPVWFFLGSKSYRSEDDGLSWTRLLTSPSLGVYNASNHQGKVVGISDVIETDTQQQASNYKILINTISSTGAASTAQHLLDLVPTSYSTGSLSVRRVAVKAAWLGGQQWVAVWEKHARSTLQVEGT
jgi:hypothetical protein